MSLLRDCSTGKLWRDCSTGKLVRPCSYCGWEIGRTLRVAFSGLTICPCVSLGTQYVDELGRDAELFARWDASDNPNVTLDVVPARNLDDDAWVASVDVTGKFVRERYYADSCDGTPVYESEWLEMPLNFYWYCLDLGFAGIQLQGSSGHVIYKGGTTGGGNIITTCGSIGGGETAIYKDGSASVTML